MFSVGAFACAGASVTITAMISKPAKNMRFFCAIVMSGCSNDDVHQDQINRDKG
jgi:hypothetical protein